MIFINALEFVFLVVKIMHAHILPLLIFKSASKLYSTINQLTVYELVVLYQKTN